MWRRTLILFVPQGISADLIATREGLYAVLDAYALLSQQRAVQAQLDKRFVSMAPMVDADGNAMLDFDEHMRPQTTLEALAALPPAFAAGRSRLRCCGAAQISQPCRDRARAHRGQFFGDCGWRCAGACRHARRW